MVRRHRVRAAGAAGGDCARAQSQAAALHASSGRSRCGGAGRTGWRSTRRCSRAARRSASSSAARASLADGGLADLRLFDAAGGGSVPPGARRPREPAWLRRPRAAGRRDEEDERLRGRLRSAATAIDRIRVDGLPAPFLKRLTLEGSGDRARWTLLAARGHAVRPAGRAARESPICRSRQARIATCASPGTTPTAAACRCRGRCGRGESRGVHRPPAAVGRRSRSSGGRASRAAAAIASACRRPRFRSWRSSSTSRRRLRVPAGDRVRVAFAGTEAAPVVLGRAQLVRVLRDGAAAESLRIPIAAPSEAEIDLVSTTATTRRSILRKVSAVFAELPWIYFEAPGRPLVARYRRPLRDAAVLRPRSGARLDRHREAADARGKWRQRRTRSPQPRRANGRRHRSVPAPSLDGEFRYSRAVTAAPRAGLVALPLDAAALEPQPRAGGAVRRRADPRPATAGRCPYLLERRDEPHR